MMKTNRVLLALVIFAGVVSAVGCHPYREVQRLETAKGWTVIVEMQKYDDGPAAAMLATVCSATGEKIQPGVAVGASDDRSKVGGFSLFEVNGIVGLFANRRPGDILILFDYKGNIWPKHNGSQAEMLAAVSWYEQALDRLPHR